MCQGHVALLESLHAAFRAGIETAWKQRVLCWKETFFHSSWGWQAARHPAAPDCEMMSFSQMCRAPRRRREARRKEKGESGEGFINCEVADLPVGPCQVQLLQFFFTFFKKKFPLALRLLDSKSIAAAVAVVCPQHSGLLRGRQRGGFGMHRARRKCKITRGDFLWVNKNLVSTLKVPCYTHF